MAEAEKDAAELGMDPEEYFTESWNEYAITLTPEEFLEAIRASGDEERFKKALEFYEEEPEEKSPPLRVRRKPLDDPQEEEEVP
jgi:hypothetical protein